MFDRRAKLGCLLLDVVPSFSEGLFGPRACDMVGRVQPGLVVLLQDLGPIDLTLLLRAINAIIARCKPCFAQALVLLLDEALCPVALPLLLPRLCWRVVEVVEGHGCWLRLLGGEQPCGFDVVRILRCLPVIMRACPGPIIANEAAAVDNFLDV